MRTLNDLLSSIPDEGGRSEILDLARQVHEAGRSSRAASSGVERQQLLDTIGARIRWHLKAARYAVPGPEELQRMIDEHFTA